MKKGLYLKLIAVILATSMLLVFTGCGSSDSNEKTIAGVLCKEFKAVSGQGDSLAIMEQLSENDVIEFSPVVTEVSEGYLPGFEKDIVGFTKGASLAPMIGSIPVVSYCFETDDVSGLTALLEESVKLDWNICTIADEYRIETAGDLVFIVLSPFEM